MTNKDYRKELWIAVATAVARNDKMYCDFAAPGPTADATLDFFDLTFKEDEVKHPGIVKGKAVLFHWEGKAISGRVDGVDYISKTFTVKGMDLPIPYSDFIDQIAES